MATASVGRIVHFVQGSVSSDQVTHKAAIVTAVESVVADNASVLSLAVFGVSSMSFSQHVPYEPTGTVPNTWHWPEVV